MGKTVRCPECQAKWPYVSPLCPRSDCWALAAVILSCCRAVLRLLGQGSLGVRELIFLAVKSLSADPNGK